MAVESFLISSLVMGALVVGIGFAVVRGRNWRSGRTQAVDHEEFWLFRASEQLGEFIRKPVAWGVAFAALILIFGGGTWLLLSGQLGTWAILGMAAIAGLVISIYLFYGTYASMRTRGLGNAAGVAAGSWAVGLLFLLVLVVKLLVA